MAIAKRAPLFIQCLLLVGSLSLAACGGGGSSGGGNKKPSDSTPNAISFLAVTNAELNTKVSSPAVTINGIDIAAPVSISGGEYSINGGAFTSAAGSITNGQLLIVRLSSSDKTNTETSVAVIVGGVSAAFSVTTAADVTPDSFTLTPAVDASLNTEYTSNTITVTGVDIAIPIAISGGLYSINGGEFTATAGSVQPNQTIAVKATSGNRTELTHNAVLTIGGVSGIFAITTLPDTTAPVAEFKFPTPYTMSEANSVIVRGTAIDENAIVSVKLVVSNNINSTVTEIDATPKSDTNGMKDFSSWTATIPLTAIAENDIKVVAADDRNNATMVANANKVTIRQANVKSAFPDEKNQFGEAANSVLDNINGRNRLLVGDRGKIWAVDIESGKRTLFIDHHALCRSIQYGLLIDHKNKKLYGICDNNLYEFDLNDGSFIDIYNAKQLTSNWILSLALDRNNGRNRIVMVDDAYEHGTSGGIVWGFSLDTKQFSLISNANTAPLIKGARNILVVGDKYLITTGGQHADGNTHKVISVDATTGEHSLVSDNSVGSGELFSGELPDGNWPAIRGIVLDNRNLIISESLSNRIISLNMDTGERSLFKNLSYSNENSVGLFIDDLDIDTTNEILIATDSIRNAIVIVDLKSREKVILSKSKNDH